MSEFGPLRESRCPAYDLADVHAAFKVGRFRVTARVSEHMRSRGWDLEILRSCVLSMRPGSFDKSQELHDGGDEWLDIYRPQWAGERWYVKFVLNDSGRGFRVLSFCLDGERH